jgi:uncharacterized YkwD family protein
MEGNFEIPFSQLLKCTDIKRQLVMLYCSCLQQVQVFKLLKEDSFMKKTSKLLSGLQIALLMTAVALPVQAAINIGAPQPLSGSVVSLRSYVPGTTYPTLAQFQWVNTGRLPLNGNGSVVSLKTTLNQPTTPVTVTPAPTPTPTPAPTPTPVAVPVSTPTIPSVTVLTADEQNMVDMINQERIAAGVNPVTVDLRLSSVGRAKANDMKVNNYFSHTSPTYGSPWAMMQQVGITVRWAGENISGNKSVAGSMAALMLSPGHKANILDPRFTHVGVGIANGSAYGNLYVQEFLQE